MNEETLYLVNSSGKYLSLPFYFLAYMKLRMELLSYLQELKIPINVF